MLDGELLAHDGDAPLPFAALQKRITRKTVPKKLLTEAPVILMAYDLLESDGATCARLPFAERRARLDALMAGLPETAPLRPSPPVPFATWEELATTRATARTRRAEGLMLKRRSGIYHAGRKKGDWWKWKLDPLSIDAVMIYAQARPRAARQPLHRFHLCRARRRGTRALHQGLFGPDRCRIPRRSPTGCAATRTERFGPVRQVRPEQVFEIAFEGIQASPRHKSGVALRFPRMARWRQDKPPRRSTRSTTCARCWRNTAERCGVEACRRPAYVWLDQQTRFSAMFTLPFPVRDANASSGGKDLGRLPDWDLSDLYSSERRAGTRA